MKSGLLRTIPGFLLLFTTHAKHLTLPVEPRNYTTRVDFGSERNSAQLQLSMTSDWTFVMSAPTCDRCPNSVYEYANSTTHKNGTHKKEKVEIGVAKDKLVLEGFSSIDTVCIFLERQVSFLE